MRSCQPCVDVTEQYIMLKGYLLQLVVTVAKAMFFEQHLS